MSAAPITDLAEFCKKNDLRLTAPRRVIFQVLTKATDHPDAVELHRRVTRIDPTIAIATVYRTLNLLQEKGILERHNFADGRARFETASREHHDHFIDVVTGQIVEFRSEEIERLQEEIAREHGFRIISHKLEIYVEPIEKKSEAHKKARKKRKKS